MNWPVHIALALLGGLAGCSLVFPYEAVPGQTDARRTDAGGVDARRADGKRETSPKRSDGPGSDLPLPRDASGADRPFSDTTVDQGADTSPSGDSSLLGVCAAPATEVPWKLNMVACKLPGPPSTNQCAAAQYCVPGWHLCTASEYLANGGQAGGPPDGGMYWLAACFRENDNVTAPRDGVCGGSCVSSVMSVFGVVWSCVPGGGALIIAAAEPLGVVTYAWCRRVGEDSSASAAYWAYSPTDLARWGAVCCR